MISLLPILDDFDRASVEIEKDLENETLKGVLLIKNKLFDSLKSKGLSLVDVKKGMSLMLMIMKLLPRSLRPVRTWWVK